MPMGPFAKPLITRVLDLTYFSRSQRSKFETNYAEEEEEETNYES
jgi:hypothetical protein